VPHPPQFYDDLNNPDISPQGAGFPRTVNGFVLGPVPLDRRRRWRGSGIGLADAAPPEDPLCPVRLG
jgi:hypothetical protein